MMQKLYATLLGLLFAGACYGQIQIVGYMANPAGTDSPYEYVLLKATQAIDFSLTPYSVVWANNGTATAAGWVAGGGLTYGFNLTSGVIRVNEAFYVGGSGKLINGSGSASLTTPPGDRFIREINTGTTAGDGFGTASTAGVMGNGGANADGIGVFSGLTSSITNTTVPIDAVFYGTAVGSAKPATGGYTLPVNDIYPTGGIFGSGGATNNLFADPASGAYTLLSGSPRTASFVNSPTQVSQLPVTYLDFKATYTPEKLVAVTWSTVTETENAYFAVERSADASSYITLGQVAGKGTTTGRQAYTFTDAAPTVGWNYYRLRQVDHDGTASYSRAVAVLNENTLDQSLTLTPNPASEQVRIKLAEGQTASRVSVIGLSGQRVTVPMLNAETLDINHLPEALYLLEVQTTEGRVVRQRLLKR